MDDAVRDALVELCRTHGTQMLDDPAKLEAFLRDTCPGSKREIHCLAGAVRDGAVSELRGRDLPPDAAEALLAARLRDDLSMQDEAADWTARSLVAALATEPPPAPQASESESEPVESEPEQQPEVVAPEVAPQAVPEPGLEGADHDHGATELSAPEAEASSPQAIDLSPRGEPTGLRSDAIDGDRRPEDEGASVLTAPAMTSTHERGSSLPLWVAVVGCVAAVWAVVLWFVHVALYPSASPRDIAGFVLLGAAAIAPLALLLIARRRTSAGSPLGSPASRSMGRVATPYAVAVVIPLAVALLLLVPAQFTTEVGESGPIVAYKESSIIAAIRNTGFAGGTWQGVAKLDGKPLEAPAVGVPGRGAAVASIGLPATVSPGEHVLEVAGVRYSFRALSPAAFSVTDLRAEPATVARIGQVVTVTAMVENTGEAEGIFDVALEAGSLEVDSGSPSISGADRRLVSYEFTPARAGKYAFDLAGATTTALVVVKPVRPGTGTVLARHTSGVGVFKFTNKMDEDCLVFLARSPNGKHPVLGLYSRAGSSCKVGSVGDGDWYVFYAAGKYWNRTTEEFLETSERSRFKNPVNFSTSQWTTSYVDYSANTRYITDHTGYTVYEIRVSDKYVWGPKGGVVSVSRAGFPGL